MDSLLSLLEPTFPPSLAQLALYGTGGAIVVLWLWKLFLMRPSAHYATLVKSFVASNVCSDWLKLRRRRKYKTEMENKGIPHEISVVLDVADPHSYLLVKALRK